VNKNGGSVNLGYTDIQEMQYLDQVSILLNFLSVRQEAYPRIEHLKGASKVKASSLPKDRVPERCFLSVRQGAYHRIENLKDASYR
jgi:hypothetical protein